jgi:NTE family protein
MAPEPQPKEDWAQHSVRVLNLIDNQVRNLRKRQLVAAYLRGDRKGAYWSIRSDIADFGLDETLPCPVDRTMALAGIATRLRSMSDGQQDRLINWGYAVADAALRRHVDPALPIGRFPYPDSGV